MQQGLLWGVQPPCCSRARAQQARACLTLCCHRLEMQNHCRTRPHARFALGPASETAGPASSPTDVCVLRHSPGHQCALHRPYLLVGTVSKTLCKKNKGMGHVSSSPCSPLTRPSPGQSGGPPCWALPAGSLSVPCLPWHPVCSTCLLWAGHPFVVS